MNEYLREFQKAVSGSDLPQVLMIWMVMLQSQEINEFNLLRSFPIAEMVQEYAN